MLLTTLAASASLTEIQPRLLPGSWGPSGVHAGTTPLLAARPLPCSPLQFLGIEDVDTEGRHGISWHERQRLWLGSERLSRPIPHAITCHPGWAGGSWRLKCSGLRGVRHGSGEPGRCHWGQRAQEGPQRVGPWSGQVGRPRQGGHSLRAACQPDLIQGTVTEAGGQIWMRPGYLPLLVAIHCGALGTGP